MSSSDGIGNLRSIEEQFDRECAAVADIRALEDIRNRYLSRKSGLLTTELQNIRNVPPSDRAAFGQTANEIKVKIEKALDALQARLSADEKSAALERDRLDVTLPGNRRRIGHPHPLTSVRKEIEDIFVAMGYTVE